MISIGIGLLFIVSGVCGIIVFLPDFLIFLRGFVPLTLILGGLVAILSGIASFSRKRPSEK